jgi:hypothetical protein
VSVDAYLTAGNPFDVVSRPELCERCGGRDCFHRHCTYKRYIGNKQVKVARFLCVLCRLTVSLLPAFVLPYRSRLVKNVDAYFKAPNDRRREMSDAELLRRYWREWVGHFESVQRDTGWPAGRRLPRKPRAYWRRMRKASGSMEAAQKHLIGRYGICLLRRYLCHVRPRRSDC